MEHIVLTRSEVFKGRLVDSPTNTSHPHHIAVSIVSAQALFRVPCTQILPAFESEERVLLSYHKRCTIVPQDLSKIGQNQDFDPRKDCVDEMGQ